MGTTEHFQRQHADLVQLSFDVVKDATPATMATDASDVRRRLARFVGRLKLHAAMENDALYPRLLQSEHAEIRDKARAMLAEVGTIYDEFFAFSRRWLQAGVIERDPSAFGTELFRVMKLLGRRMSRETKELYPLVDALEG